VKKKKMGIHITQFTFNALQENTVVIDDGQYCVIIDPGCYDRTEEAELVDFIREKQLEPKAVLLTHAHIDHVLGVAYLTRHFDIGYRMHQADASTLQAVQSYAHLYGFPGYTPPEEPEAYVEDGAKLVFGEIELEVYFTPGHSPGHVVYYLPSEKAVINGDVLFAGSFGRVDLPGGDLETLKKSIFHTMFALPEDTLVYCGHGPTTTIGQEKRTNYIHRF
jgi:glyoxylase-like metal-dependent hydrolase (beta-lactamase superfamily II)